MNIQGINFTLGELEMMTGGFSNKQRIREQDSSDLFTGTTETGQILAIKRMKNRADRVMNFNSEIDVLSTVSHPNIIRLIGSFSNEKESIVVYEYMPSGTLHDQLHDSFKPGLSWNLRMLIAARIADALLYLHEAQPPIVYGSLKPKNVFLNDHLEPKLSDFAIVKSALSEPVSLKLDVYTFGVMLVEIIRSKKPKDITRDTSKYTRDTSKYLGDRLRKKIAKNRDLLKIADPKMKGKFPEIMLRKALQIAIACLNKDPSMRPDMKEVSIAMSWLSPDRNIDADEDWPTIFNIASLSIDEPADLSAKFRYFNFEEIVVSTVNFCHKIGDCDFGHVYIGREQQTGKSLEVKRQMPLNHEGATEFKVERMVTALLKQHPNIVRVLGICEHENEHMIVRDHVGASLYRYLHARGIGHRVLDWNERMKIATGIARGLSYLHQEAIPPVAHMNIKSSTIVIDCDFQPRISDFEKAKYNTDSEGDFIPDKLSFGVLLLEIVSGRKEHDPALGNASLVDWVKSKLHEDNISEVVDPLLEDKFPIDIARMIVILALKCMTGDLLLDMSEIVDCLTYLAGRPYNSSVPIRRRLLMLAEGDDVAAVMGVAKDP